MGHLSTEKRVKPTTLLNYGILLAQPEVGTGTRTARIMRAFGGRRLFNIAATTGLRIGELGARRSNRSARP